MQQDPPENLDAAGLRIAIAVSEYHREITRSMRDAASETFILAGGRPHDLHAVAAPGAFELTVICRALANLQLRTGRAAFDAIVALGCVLTGETTHDQYLAHAVSQGLTAVSIDTGVPIAFGVLTCQTLEQARARSVDAQQTGKCNKGAEAMQAAIATAVTLRSIAGIDRNWRSRGGIA